MPVGWPDGDGRAWWTQGYFAVGYWNIHYWVFYLPPWLSGLPNMPTNPSMPWIKRKWWTQIWRKIPHK